MAENWHVTINFDLTGGSLEQVQALGPDLMRQWVANNGGEVSGSASTPEEAAVAAGNDPKMALDLYFAGGIHNFLQRPELDGLTVSDLSVNAQPNT